jgi:tripartite ATP-independent transporter DctM subunit
MITIAVYVRLKPDSAGQREPADMGERLSALVSVWPVLLIFTRVIGGIYFGWFTPTEGAAVGAAGTGLIALFNGGLTWRSLGESITGTAISTGMIFFIVLGAAVYNGFLAFSQLPQETANYVATLGVSPWLVLVLILACYLVFGCVMDSLSMILLTIPIFFPIVSVLDFGLPAEEMAIWFGIVVLITVEVGLITPPVGMNLFVINSMAPDVPLPRTYGGALPFVLSDVIRVAILVLFPSITLGLVRLLY